MCLGHNSLVCIHKMGGRSDTACRRSAGLRDGTFFAKSHLTLQQWMVLMYWCSYRCSQEAKVEENTAVQAYQYFRDICSWWLLNHDAPLMLGGPGVVVHIDESLFRHKPKVWYTCMTSIVSMMSSSTIVGVHPLPPGKCGFFGLCDTSHTPALWGDEDSS